MTSRAGNRDCFPRTPLPTRDRTTWLWSASRGMPAWALVIALLAVATVQGQDPETPLTRLRPITEGSAVDQFAREQSHESSVEINGPLGSQVGANVVTAQWASTPFEAGVPVERQTSPEGRHTAMMQFQMPGGQAAPTMAPPATSSDASMIPPPSLGPSSGTVLGPSTPPTFSPAPTTIPPSFQGVPTMAPPRGLPMSPGMTSSPPMVFTPVPSSRDLLPVNPPQLNDQFATIDNCSCVSPPSGYVAATGWTQPSPTTSFVATPAPSAYIAPVAAPVAGLPVIPDASTMPKGSGVPRHSLISFGQNRNPIVVGQGVIGQPVAYVPGQPVRNWIRWVFP